MKKQINGPYKVYVGLIPSGYTSIETIQSTILAGLRFCDFTPSHKKELLAWADLALRTRTFLNESLSVNPRFLSATLGAIKSLASTEPRLIVHSPAVRQVVERNLLEEFPTEELSAYDEANYLLSLGSLSPDHDKTTNIGYREHNSIRASKLFSNSPDLVFIPKLRSISHQSGFSGALRLGSQLGTHSTEESIADYLEIACPKIVVSDGIECPYGGNEASQARHELGMILVANNSVAHDMAAAFLFHKDPLKIPHLVAAANRGWGPTELKKIQWGGAGLDGINKLKMKTSHWNDGRLNLEDFQVKYSHENAGLQFPLQIISSNSNEKNLQTCKSQFLNWLYSFYDSPLTRLTFTNWRAATVIIGAHERLPHNSTVFLIGDEAIRSFLEKCVHHSPLFSLLKWGFFRAKIRNRKDYNVWYCKGSAPSLSEIGRLFFWGSFGKIRTKTNLYFGKTEKKPPLETLPLIKTEILNQNYWW